MWRTTHSRGFTLVEMLVVVAIVSLMASIALPIAELAVKRQKEEELRVALRQIRDAIDAYKRAVDTGRITRKADESGYPANLRALVEGVEDQSDPQRRKLYLLRRLPIDPFADSSMPPEQTWDTREYASPPDDPHEGRDVFDIYSRSTGIGLNGIAYSKW